MEKGNGKDFTTKDAEIAKGREEREPQITRIFAEKNVE